MNPQKNAEDTVHLSRSRNHHTQKMEMKLQLDKNKCSGLKTLEKQTHFTILSRKFFSFLREKNALVQEQNDKCNVTDEQMDSKIVRVMWVSRVELKQIASTFSAFTSRAWKHQSLRVSHWRNCHSGGQLDNAVCLFRVV